MKITISELTDSADGHKDRPKRVEKLVPNPRHWKLLGLRERKKKRLKKNE